MDIHLCGHLFPRNPTSTTPNGRVVTFVSRGCCPYLDDYEPNYTPAVPVAVQSKANEKLRNTVTWDPPGPQYDEPTPYQETKKRPAHPQKGGQPTTPTLRFLQLGGQLPTPTPTVRYTRKSGRPTTTPTLAQPPKPQPGQRLEGSAPNQSR